ncbi:hypothetical protein V8C26DRAFT_392823 [Trichoderma gracile]
MPVHLSIGRLLIGLTPLATGIIVRPLNGKLGLTTQGVVMPLDHPAASSPASYRTPTIAHRFPVWHEILSMLIHVSATPFCSVGFQIIRRLDKTHVPNPLTTHIYG